MMWMLAAIFSAVFAGLTSILAKCGIKKTDSDLATALRTVVVLAFSWIMVFVVAGAMAFVVRTFIFEPVRVDGASMMYTLEDGEFMIATKYDYLLGDPERFDIVICNYPNTSDGMYRVKRVIGMPDETIELREWLDIGCLVLRELREVFLA